ncbi:fluoride efflux transporter CrcB [Pseudogracilibacillus auburnensis]|nr:fluoride efflux transporter CrcB [Pseudogracilibacillus auburnensis]
MMIQLLFVAIGGFFGSIIRFFISNRLNKHFFGTWIANISGSILLAILLRYYLTGTIPDYLWLLLGVGFCGAYTTFSTFGNETIQLLLAKKYQTAMYYVLSSFTLSIILVGIVLVW